MIEKAYSWKPGHAYNRRKQLDQNAIKHQAILRPEFTRRGIEKDEGAVNRRKKIVVNNDLTKKEEITDGVHRQSNSRSVSE